MKKIAFIFYLASMLIFAACGNDAEMEKQEQMRNEVFAIHDGVMPRMSEIVQLKGQLMDMQVDSTKEAEVKAAISQLEKAEDGMMQWMGNFTQPEKLREGKKTHEEIMEYLQNEKKVISKVRDDMNNSIEVGQRILKANTQ